MPMGIKEFGVMISIWFSKKNIIQKSILIIYAIILIYEFFNTPSQYQFFSFLLVSVPILALLIFFCGKFKT